jgi:hypothetical protein
LLVDDGLIRKKIDGGLRHALRGEMRGRADDAHSTHPIFAAGRFRTAQ